MICLRMTLIMLSFLALLPYGIGHAAEQTVPRRIALVIGNTAYPTLPLPNARNDARLVARSLEAADFTLIEGHPLFDLSADGLRDAAKSFSRSLGPNTVAVLYFAGHGIEDHGKNYLIPADIDITNAMQTFDLLDVDQLMKQVERARSSMTIIILDACRTNPIAGLRGATAGLAQMQAPRGTVVAFATQPGHAALDGRSGNSPYALALAETIRTPGLDVFNTFNEIARQVDDATQHEQTPWFSSSPISGQFYFTPPPAQPSPIVASLPTPDRATDMEKQDSVPIAPGQAFAARPAQPAAPDVVVASLPSVRTAPQTAIEPSAPSADFRELGRQLQVELRRVGCYRGTVDGVWGASSVAALQTFNQRANTTLMTQHPSAEAVAAISARAAIACQPTIARTQPRAVDPSSSFEGQRRAATPEDPTTTPSVKSAKIECLMPDSSSRSVESVKACYALPGGVPLH